MKLTPLQRKDLVQAVAWAIEVITVEDNLGSTPPSSVSHDVGFATVVAVRVGQGIYIDIEGK